jgi:hypothetical protein
MDADSATLVLILVAVTETIDDLKTAEGEWVEDALLKLGRIRVSILQELAATGPN